MRKLAIIAIILLMISASAVVAAPSSTSLSGQDKGTVMWATAADGTQYMYEKGDQDTWVLRGERSSSTAPITPEYGAIRTSDSLATFFQDQTWKEWTYTQPTATSTPAPTPPAETTAPATSTTTQPTATSTPAPTPPAATAQSPTVQTGETAPQQVTEAGEGPGGAAGPVATAPGAEGQGAEQGLGATEEEISLQQMEKGPGGVTPPAQPTPTGPAGQTLMGRIGGDTTVRRDSSGQLNFYHEDGTQITGTDLETYRSAHAEEIDSYEKQARTQMENEGTFLTNFVQYYRVYSGLQGYSSLIFDKEFLANWRNRVNDIFCNKVLGYLPLSRDCWTSTVCGVYTEITPPQDGVLFTSPVGGLPAVSAHIEGERSLPIVTPSQTSWVYKVTFSVTNPLDDTLKINVYFQSAEKKAAWWPADQEIGEGNTFAAVGASALMKLSSTDYTSVCLSFSPSLEAFGGRRTGSICNSITQYSGAATMPYAVTTGTETAAQPGATTPAAPTTPGANI